MSFQLPLFHDVPAEAITLFDVQNQPLSKIADLGKYQITTDIASHFKNLITRQRQDITGHGQHLSPSGILGDRKNPNDIFIDLDVAIEFAVQSKKPKIVAIVKWLIKKEVERKQKGHHQQGTQLQQAITQ